MASVSNIVCLQTTATNPHVAVVLVYNRLLSRGLSLQSIIVALEHCVSGRISTVFSAK